MVPPPRPPRPAALVAALASALAGSIAAAQPAPPAAAALPSPAAARPAALLRQSTLDNGLDVIVVENHSVPLATVKLVVRTGAMSQQEEEQGIPHLFEHMLFRGYRAADGRSFAMRSAELQASYNGTTAEELVTYYMTMPSAGTEASIRLLSELVRDARFTDTDLRTERFVVLGELQRASSEPRELLRRSVGEALWRDGWPRKNTIGLATALLGAAPKRLEEIYRQYYVPNNAALVVTGDVDAARVLESARRHFGGWRRGPDPFAARSVAPMPALDSSAAIVMTGDVGAVTLMLQWQGPRARDEVGATYDADVLGDVLSDPDSRFSRRLVDEGPFQSASMGYQTLAHTGPITFVGTTTAEQLSVALSVLASELAMMGVDDYFEPRELATAAKRRRVGRSFEREEGVTLAHALAYAWAVTGLPYHDSYADSLATRRPADLTRFVGRYLTGRPLVAGVLLPPGREQESAVMLQQFLDFMREDR